MSNITNLTNEDFRQITESAKTEQQRIFPSTSGSRTNDPLIFRPCPISSDDIQDLRSEVVQLADKVKEEGISPNTIIYGLTQDQMQDWLAKYIPSSKGRLERLEVYSELQLMPLKGNLYRTFGGQPLLTLEGELDL